tara:strand:+ start:11538 stop:12803 length:1266 start_codon:yes stop_codon:yes gene_type:complete
VLKDVLSTLYLDIYNSISESVEIRDVLFIEDLKGYPGEMDLGIVAKAFTVSFFQIKSLNDAIGNKNTKFSIGNIHSYVESSSIKRSPDLKKRLKGILEKKYKLKNLDNFANIATQLLRWRNFWAHEGGFQNVSQAMVLQANLSLLLKTYPDQLKEKISGFDQYLEFVDEEFFQSISDFLLSTKEEDIDDEIRQHFEQDQATNLSTDFNTFSEKVDSKISSISEENETNTQNIEKLLDLQDSTFSKIEELSKSINGLYVVIENLKDQVNSISLKDQPNIKSDIQKDFDESEVPIVDFKENLSDNTKKPSEDSTEDKSLTNAEAKDNLIALREKIKKHMKEREPNFQNWHNILMRPLIEELLRNKINKDEIFKDTLIFRHYYNCQSLRGEESFEDEKQLTQELMDYQLENYWEHIQSIVGQIK